MKYARANYVCSKVLAYITFAQDMWFVMWQRCLLVIKQWLTTRAQFQSQNDMELWNVFHATVSAHIIMK